MLRRGVVAGAGASAREVALPGAHVERIWTDQPVVVKLLNDVRTDVETGTSLSAAFRKYPMYFNALYCNLVEAGEAAGILATSVLGNSHFEK